MQRGGGRPPAAAVLALEQLRRQLTGRSRPLRIAHQQCGPGDEDRSLGDVHVVTGRPQVVDRSLGQRQCLSGQPGRKQHLAAVREDGGARQAELVVLPLGLVEPAKGLDQITSPTGEPGEVVA